MAKKNLEVERRHAEVSEQPDAAAGRPHRAYGLVGQGGTQFIDRAAPASTACVTGTIPGGYGDALSSLFRRTTRRWTVQLNVSYPLGIERAGSHVARARVQLNQVQAQLKQIELQVATDVTNAAIQRAEQRRARRRPRRRRASWRSSKLEAEQSKFEVGMSTNYFVVQAQRDLADAQNNELQRVLNYRKALVELERLQQTSLQTSNITILGR